jgi:hypothetical protein
MNITPGEFQFNVVVPANAPEGDQPIVASYRGAATQSGRSRCSAERPVNLGTCVDHRGSLNRNNPV